MLAILIYSLYFIKNVREIKPRAIAGALLVSLYFIKNVREIKPYIDSRS